MIETAKSISYDSNGVEVNHNAVSPTPKPKQHLTCGWVPLLAASKILGKTRRTLMRWANMPNPPVRFKKFGGQWMVRKEDLQ